MKKIIFILSIFLGICAFSQEQDSIKNAVTYAEKGAEYEGGMEVFRQDIMKKFRTKKIQGKGISVTNIIFVVERDGKVSNIKAMGDNESFNKEAERALSKMKPKWNAGSINGENVRSRFKVPLTATFYE